MVRLHILSTSPESINNVAYFELVHSYFRHIYDYDVSGSCLDFDMFLFLLLWIPNFIDQFVHFFVINTLFENLIKISVSHFRFDAVTIQ